MTENQGPRPGGVGWGFAHGKAQYLLLVAALAAHAVPFQAAGSTAKRWVQPDSRLATACTPS